jgi:gliding motility-associated-like protein
MNILNKPVLFIIIFFPMFVFAQNLVPNPSFEDTIYCPNGTNDFSAVDSWYNATLASPDFYNACAQNGGGVPTNDWGFQYAKDGLAYVGLITYGPNDYREYIQIKLLEKLEATKTYCWSFWISLLDSVDFASNNLGISLSNTEQVNFTTESILQVQNITGLETNIVLDNLNWHQVSGSFIANGNEEFLTIGNFLSNPITNVEQINNNSIGGEFAYYYIDFVYLGEQCESSFVEIPNVFTPDNDGVNDTFKVMYKNVSDLKITILNRWGNVIYEGNEALNWDGKFKDQNCTEGIYFFICSYTDIHSKSDSKTGYFQLIRK